MCETSNSVRKFKENIYRIEKSDPMTSYVQIQIALKGEVIFNHTSSSSHLYVD